MNLFVVSVVWHFDVVVLGPEFVNLFMTLRVRETWSDFCAWELPSARGAGVSFVQFG